jgi:5'-methylthioadenosine phosphorylase
MAKRKIALLGGSGLEKFNISLKSNSLNPNTPYGKCSSSILHSQNDYFEIFYVSRHGFKHQYAPQEVNNRAHIWAFKDIGCDFILATSASVACERTLSRAI